MSEPRDCVERDEYLYEYLEKYRQCVECGAGDGSWCTLSKAASLS